MTSFPLFFPTKRSKRKLKIHHRRFLKHVFDSACIRRFLGNQTPHAAIDDTKSESQNEIQIWEREGGNQRVPSSGGRSRAVAWKWVKEVATAKRRRRRRKCSISTSPAKTCVYALALFNPKKRREILRNRERKKKTENLKRERERFDGKEESKSRGRRWRASQPPLHSYYYLFIWICPEKEQTLLGFTK